MAPTRLGGSHIFHVCPPCHEAGIAHIINIAFHPGVSHNKGRTLAVHNISFLLVGSENAQLVCCTTLLCIMYRGAPKKIKNSN